MSSVVNADRIFVLNKGRLAETGSHEELIRKNGIYAELFRMQAQNYITVRDYPWLSVTVRDCPWLSVTVRDCPRLSATVSEYEE